MRKLLLAAIVNVVPLALSAQEFVTTPPYNPDSNSDSLIGSADLVDLLPLYGEQFSPEPLTIEGIGIQEWMEQLGGLTGGVCDVLIPDGLNNVVTVLDTVTSESPYVVPQGKNLYLVQYANIDGCDWCDLSINIISDDGQQSTSGVYSPYSCPLIFSDNHTITVNNGCTGIIGFLVDKRVDPIVISNYISTPFVVPESKLLYVMKVSGSVTANGISLPNFDTAVPIILESGTELFNDNNASFWCNEGATFGTSSLNGYLVDEDYFSNCGGSCGCDESDNDIVISMTFPDDYGEVDGGNNNETPFVNISEETDFVYFHQTENQDVDFWLPQGSERKVLQVFLSTTVEDWRVRIFLDETQESAIFGYAWGVRSSRPVSLTFIRGHNGRWYQPVPGF